MGRPPSNGVPAFRFTPTEVTEMETILQNHNYAMPARDVLTALAEKFSESLERKGKITVQMKQVWNWFQNKRYAIRAKSSKTPGKLNITPMPRDESTTVRNIPQLTAGPIPATSGSGYFSMLQGAASLPNIACKYFSIDDHSNKLSSSFVMKHSNQLFRLMIILTILFSNPFSPTSIDSLSSLSIVF